MKKEAAHPEKEKGGPYRVLLLSLSILTSLVLITYVRYSPGSNQILIQFLYVPIVLSGLWWPKKGMRAALLISALLLISGGISHRTASLNDLFQSVVFIVVSWTATSVGTRLGEAEMSSRDALAELEQIFNTTANAVCVIDKNFSICRFNESFLELLGKSKNDICGSKCYEVIESKFCPTSFCPLIRIQAGEERIEYEELRLSGPSKDSVPCIITATAYRDYAGNLLGIIKDLKDITDRKRHENLLSYAATHDNLTGLPNRILFNDRLALALTQAERRRTKLGIIFLDLNRFKEVNDRYGHDLGDQVLRSAGERLKNVLRRADTIARLGGDEFLILLSEIAEAENAAEIAEKLVESMDEPFVVEGKALRIGVSAGISIYPDDGLNAASLLKKADLAMYHAKESGSNHYRYYDPEMESLPPQLSRRIS